VRKEHAVISSLIIILLHRKLQHGLAELDSKGTYNAREKYRELQYIIGVVNDSCRIYLTWFPCILLTETAIMLYGTVRFVYLPIYSYLMYPACAVRCIIESMTLLSLAGQVNIQSKALKAQWKQEEVALSTSGSNVRVLRKFRKSCRHIQCTAGSLYTFEKSIVLVTISNCFHFTVELLVMY